MVGSCVSHYRILEKLASGGMGSVYVALDTHLNRRVAIKFPSLGENEQDRRSRFLAEARAASRLDHPNIARIYDYGEAPDGHPFLVMELVQGTTLRQVLKKGPLSPARSIAIMECVLRGLREAHRNALVHRDIKPANVMLAETGDVKILDFGLVKEIPQVPIGRPSQAVTVPMAATHPGLVPGTPEYMSPEQVRGSLIDGRSDIFSAALVFYECLTGRPAFFGQTVAEILAQVQRFNPPKPSASVSGISATLDRITSKALAKNAADRYQNADEMLQDLASAKGRPASRILRSAVSGLVAPRPRIRLAIPALLLVAVAVWLMSRTRLHEPPPEAQRWYQVGAAALRDGTYYRATKALEQSIAIDPDYALAHARLAEARNELDDSEKAKEEMLKALAAQAGQMHGKDALYVDAIHRTLTGDFPGAIRTYTELAAGASGAEKAAVLVDLGRARERNDEFPKAFEHYREAKQVDPQNAAAHLRAGILLGRQQNPAQTVEFAKAESLYESLSNTEGQAEVLYRRGVIASTMLKLAEARASLDKAVQLARAISSDYQETAATLQLGIVTYLEGDISRAEEIASEAVARARRAGMSYLAARGLVDLGTAQAGKGNSDRAEASFLEALDLARRSRMHQAEARALFSLASLHQGRGHAAIALQEIEPALASYRQAGFRQESIACLMVIARAQRDLGKDSEALATLQQVLSSAQVVDDRAMMAAAEQGIASVLLHQENWPEALSHYEKYHEIGRSIPNRDVMSRGLLGRANVLWKLGRYQEAEPLYKEAQDLISPSNPLGATIAERRAAMALSSGKHREAAANARRTWEMESAPARTRANARCTGGLALARAGSAREGKRLGEECLAVFSKLADRFDFAEARIVLAEILTANGEAKASQEQIRLALEVIDGYGYKELAWRAWVLAARAYRRDGDVTGAKKASQYAAERLDEMRSKYKPADFETYLQRPDIRILEREIKQ